MAPEAGDPEPGEFGAPGEAGEGGGQDAHVAPGGFRGALRWSYAMDGGRFVVTTLVMVALAALLGPEAFGTVAIALVYVLLVQLILQQGMVPALIQRRTLDRADLDSAFWVVCGAAVVLTLLTALGSGWFAAVNDLPELRNVVLVLALVLPVRAVGVVPEALLRRDMQFRELAIIVNVAVVTGGVVGLSLAVAGAGVWALVAQQVTTAVVETMGVWYRTRFRPGLRVERDRAIALVRFSSGSVAAGLGAFVTAYSDALVIGLFFGPVAVGLYRLAARFTDMVIELTARALQSVSLPELARHQHDRDRFAARFVDLVGIGALVALPTLGILAATSGPITAILGPDWHAAAAPMRVLCFVAGVTALTMFNGPVLLALGRPHALALLAWVAGALSAGAYVIAGFALDTSSVSDQILGVSLARAVLYGAVVLVVNGVVATRMVGVRPGRLLGAILPPALAGTASALVGVAVAGAPFVADLAPFAQLVVTGGAAALPAAVAALVVWRRRGTLLPASLTASVT